MREIYRFACPTRKRHCSIYRSGGKFKCQTCESIYSKIFDKKEKEFISSVEYKQRIKAI